MNKNSFLKKKLTSKSQFALLLFLAFIFSLSFVNIAAAKSILIGTSADNVGIGTTAPASKLDVLGNISIYGGMGGTSGYGINLPSTSNDFISIIGENDGGDTSNGVFYTGDNEGDGWYFRERDCCGLGTGDYMRIARNGVYYNGTGNFGIGITNPDSKLQIYGPFSSFIDGNVRHYYNVASYTNSPITGTMVVTLPKYGSNTMLSIKISGYDYTEGRGYWEVLIGGYNYSGGHNWYSKSVTFTGTPPFTTVRLANNGTNDLILLGDTSTNWTHPKVTVSDVITGYNNPDNWGNGWSMNVVSSEPALYNIFTLMPKSFMDYSGNFGIGTTAPNYKLDVNGDGNFGGYQIHNVGSPSQGSDAATKSYVDSTVNTGVSSVAWSAITGRPGWLAGGSYISSAPSDLNSWMDSGFYQSDGSNTNNPVGTWFNFINVRHSNQGNYHGFQLGMSYYDNNLWWRSYQDLGTFQNWVHAISNAGGAIDGGLTVAGNVGIGTTNPGTNKLRIASDLGSNDASAYQHYMQLEVRKASDNKSLAIGILDNGTGVIQAKEIGVGYQSLVLNPVSGNLGIGLTAPSYKLDVNGDGNFRGYQIHSVGTPSQDSDAATKSYVDSAVGSGWRASGSWKPGSLSDATRLIGITSPDSGEFALGYKNGQIYPYTDGWFYQNEGQYRVLDTSDVSNLSVGSAKNAPIFISSLYGANGDFPFRTTSQSPVAMRQVYAPFAFAQPSCPSGTTKYYRVYSELVDGLHSGGVMFRMDFGDGHTLDFNMGITWGGSPAYRTYLSGLFQEGDTNHATMYTWLGNSPTGTITADIRKVELWAYCI